MRRDSSLPAPSSGADRGRALTLIAVDERPDGSPVTLFRENGGCRLEDQRAGEAADLELTEVPPNSSFGFLEDRHFPLPGDPFPVRALVTALPDGARVHVVYPTRASFIIDEITTRWAGMRWMTSLENVWALTASEVPHLLRAPDDGDVALDVQVIPDLLISTPSGADVVHGPGQFPGPGLPVGRRPPVK